MRTNTNTLHMDNIFNRLTLEACAEYFETSPSCVLGHERGNTKPKGGRAAQMARGHAIRILREFTNQSSTEIGELFSISRASVAYYLRVYCDTVDARYEQEHDDIKQILFQKLCSFVLAPEITST